MWAFTKHKNLKAASLKASSDKPPLTSRADSEIPERGKWRVGSKVPLNVYDGDRPVCQCHGFMDALEIVNAMNTIRHVERLSGGFRFVPTSRGLRVHDLSGTWDTCRIEKEISETGLYQDFAYFPNREDAAAVFALLTQPAGGPPTSDPAASPNSTP